MQRIVLLLVFISAFVASVAAEPDKIYNPNIKTVQLYQAGNQMSYPVININAANAMQLEFDELGDEINNYYYTYQLCNADWQPVDLSTFDYIRGFTQNRINTYRVSSIALTKYIHYSASLPERNCMPIKTGNYLLKVFTNGDTSELVFTKRFLVTDNSASVGAQLLQAFNPQFFRTHHKIQFTIDQSKLNIVNVQQQIKVVVMQNWRWDNAISKSQPTFIKGNILEYSGDNEFIFPAGKEYRWADLRSFRFQSDRMARVDKLTRPWTVDIMMDNEKNNQRYIYFRDYNGFYEISTTDNVNPLWQGDYANVNFRFEPTGNQPFAGKKLFIIGQFNNYALNDESELKYNAEKGIYETTLFLKQGYYNYTYATKSANGEIMSTDANYWETENEYTVLVYYRPLSGRSDELIGVASLNSRNFTFRGQGL